MANFEPRLDRQKCYNFARADEGDKRSSSLVLEPSIVDIWEQAGNRSCPSCFRVKTQSNDFCQRILPAATMAFEPTVLDTKVFLADGSVEHVAWKAWPSPDASHETNK
eukprot:s9994_g2.t1